MLRRFALPLMLLLLPCALHAATIHVGPQLPVSRIADAARLARDGDVIEVQGGEYRGDVAVWTQKKLTLRAPGKRAVILADGKHAEGKAIWVIRNGDFVVENFEFRGTRVPDQNGAGIRLESGRLVVRNCAFIDNQMGLLTANHRDAELKIENTLFADAPKQEGSLPHLLYAGSIARLEISGSRFHKGYRGHLIKSRARFNDFRHNLVVDGPEGQASYEIDLPNGGIAWLVGNVVGQSAATQNAAVVSFGAEGSAWPENTLFMVHNTLINERTSGAWFLKVPLEKFPAPPTVVAVNNLTIGTGLFTLAAPGFFRGNFPALSSVLGNPDTFDFTLSRNSILRGRGVDPNAIPELKDGALVPHHEFQWPIGTRPLPAPAEWTPGAFQSWGG